MKPPFVSVRAHANTGTTQHDGNLPKTMPEKREFKANIVKMKIKPDEENFEEAEAQAWRVWSEPAVSQPEELHTVQKMTYTCSRFPLMYKRSSRCLNYQRRRSIMQLSMRFCRP